MRVIIAGGGTGGHLFPGIAIAEELARRGGHDVLFVGTRQGIEARVLPREGYACEFIDVGGLKGRGAAGLLAGLLRVPRAMWQSFAVLRRVRPALVVGVGGYASGPMLLVAALAGYPTAILEQNSVPGFTNRVLGRVVRAVFAAFEESRRFFPARKVRLAGNPIRAGFLVAGGIHDEEPGADAAGAARARPAKVLLVCGGSQGAHAVNEAVVEAMLLLASEARAPRVVHQSGERDRDSVVERYRAAGIDADVRAFIHDMAAAYRSADLIVARAGATTIAEATAIGRAMLFIPLPSAADDHQTVNGRSLEQAGAARVFPQADVTPRLLADAIAELLSDDEARTRMAEAARALGRPHAAREIVDELCQIAGTA